MIIILKDNKRYETYSDEDYNSIKDFIVNNEPPDIVRNKSFDIINTILKSNWESIRIEKKRIYIKDPNQVPKGVKVQRGKRGGLYYETSELSGGQQQYELPDYAKEHETVFENFLHKKQGDTSIWKSKEHNFDVSINDNDVPDNIDFDIHQISRIFRSINYQNRLKINYLGKSTTREFTYIGSDGKEYKTTINALADYEKNNIDVYDNYEKTYEIIPHEIGHHVLSHLVSEEMEKPRYEDEIKNSHLTKIKSVNSYNKALKSIKDNGFLDRLSDLYFSSSDSYIVKQITKNAKINVDELRIIIDTINNRKNSGITPELHDDEIKMFKAYQNDKKKILKSNEILNEWKKIHSDEGYDGNIYAGRNYHESFAEFFGEILKLFNDYSAFWDIPKNEIEELKAKHPKKFAFMEKYVIDKYIKNKYTSEWLNEHR